MPTTATNTYQDSKLSPSRHPELAFEERFQMTASTTFTKGMAVAIVTATGKLGIYADAGSGGLGVMRGICPYGAVSDGSGNITIQGGNPAGTTEDTIPVFIAGYFFTADLTGVDAAGVADLGGHLVWGDYTTGEIRLP
jgi:hypothetical protein